MLNARVNHALLKWLCDRMIPPSAVDCLRWRELIDTLNPDVGTASGTTIVDNFITTESAYIHQDSVDALANQELLTLSYDGGTTRRHESVYTVHVTTPTTREAHLMEGSEASGVSHTPEHLCSVLDRVCTRICLLYGGLLIGCVDLKRGRTRALCFDCFRQCREYTCRSNADRARISLDHCSPRCMPPIE